MLKTANISETYCMDNLQFMRQIPDNYFDWIITDPEYRDVNAPDINLRSKGGMKTWLGMPKAEFFTQLFRISKNQSVWGGNYFQDIINPETGKPFLGANNNWLIWDKKIADGLHYSMAEMCWNSMRKNIKIFKHRPMGDVQKWHETSKPIELYRYMFETYGEAGWKIGDMNLGSGNSRKAAYILGFDFIGTEIQRKYYDKERTDFEDFKTKFSMFNDNELVSSGLNIKSFNLNDL